MNIAAATALAPKENMSTKDAERARVSSELRAGRAVAAGALLAGPLSKRSDWLHTWNKRFCVLTTEALSWHKDSGLEAVSDSRVLRMFVCETMKFVRYELSFVRR